MSGDAFSGSEGPALIATGIVASYGRGPQATRVLHGVSFALSPNSCLAVVGESGSGKTTLGRCVAGLHVPDEGSITLMDSMLAPSVRKRGREDHRYIQIVFQNPDRSLNPQRTVGQAIGRPLRLFGSATNRAEERREVLRLLERVHLPAATVNRFPAELSGGEKQRAAIARALAARPSVLICDEITSALDVSIQAAIVRLLEELRRDGLALLFITHNLALVNSIADEVLVLESGRVREYSDRAAVIERPAHPYTRELVAAAPDLRDHAGALP